MYSKDYDRWKAFITENNSFEALQRANEYQTMVECTKELPDDISPREYTELIKNPRSFVAWDLVYFLSVRSELKRFLSFDVNL